MNEQKTVEGFLGDLFELIKQYENLKAVEIAGALSLANAAITDAVNQDVQKFINEQNPTRPT